MSCKHCLPSFNFSAFVVAFDKHRDDDCLVPRAPARSGRPPPCAGSGSESDLRAGRRLLFGGCHELPSRCGVNTSAGNTAQFSGGTRGTGDDDRSAVYPSNVDSRSLRRNALTTSANSSPGQGGPVHALTRQCRVRCDSLRVLSTTTSFHAGYRSGCRFGRLLSGAFDDGF